MDRDEHRRAFLTVAVAGAARIVPHVGALLGTVATLDARLGCRPGPIEDSPGLWMQNGGSLPPPQAASRHFIVISRYHDPNIAVEAWNRAPGAGVQG